MSQNDDAHGENDENNIAQHAIEIETTFDQDESDYNGEEIDNDLESNGETLKMTMKTSRNT